MAYFHLSVTTGHQRDHCEGRRRPYESSHRVCFCIVAAGRRGCLAATAIVRATDERLASTGVYADKDTNKRGQCQILFEHCRAGVSKAQPKIRISGGNVKFICIFAEATVSKTQAKVAKKPEFTHPQKQQDTKHEALADTSEPPYPDGKNISGFRFLPYDFTPAGSDPARAIPVLTAYRDRGIVK